MNIIDSHHHLWDLEQRYYPWLCDPEPEPLFYDYGPIRQRSYRRADYRADVEPAGVVASVHVQANYDPSDPVGETRWLHAVAEEVGGPDFPHAVVAFADLSDPAVERVLAEHARYPRVRGIRQSINRHPDPRYNLAPHDYLNDKTWRDNLGLLARYGLSFDLELYPSQMAAAAELVASHEKTPFVVTHAGMPLAREKDAHATWRRGIRLLAHHPNVAVKISGFGMFDARWSVASIRPYVEELIDVFAPSRCMFGSNLPVDSMFRSPLELWQAYLEIIASYSDAERQDLFFDTGRRVYRIAI